MIQAAISAVDYHVPELTLTNSELAALYPEWTAERIEKKLGIVCRHISSGEECSSDLGVKAANRLFERGVCHPSDIDYVLFCTQTPDYFLPTTACLVQDRLGISRGCGALDINLGCSGYVYGLGLAKGLVETGQSSCLLLITADTYSKFIHPQDKSVRTLFGDGASATLIGAADLPTSAMGPFVMGTDGSGARNLIVESGGLRHRATDAPDTHLEGTPIPSRHLFMDGSEIFNFTVDVVPKAIHQLLAKSKQSIADIDLFIFHQANEYMLDFLRKKCQIPEEKFFICMRDFGNTVSSTIPIALRNAELDGALKPGAKVMLVGFGVGYSWAATLVQWRPNVEIPAPE